MAGPNVQRYSMVEFTQEYLVHDNQTMIHLHPEKDIMRNGNKSIVVNILKHCDKRFSSLTLRVSILGRCKNSILQIRKLKLKCRNNYLYGKKIYMIKKNRSSKKQT